jgi:hypothetical protein
MRREDDGQRRCDEERVDDLRTRDGGGRERCVVKKAVSRRSVGVLCRQLKGLHLLGSVTEPNKPD